MFEVDGKLLTSEEVAKLSIAKNITGHDITNRMNEHGWSLEKALTQEKHIKGRKYEYNGKSYTEKELLEFSAVPELTVSQLHLRLVKHGWSIERALTQPLHTKKAKKGVGDRIYEYKGKMYNSYELTQISPVKGLTIGNITCRINHHGWSVERAITTPKKKKDILFDYEGNKYDSHSLAKICVDNRMTYHDVTDRYRFGWTPWEIVNIPKGTTRKQYYKMQNN